VNAAAGLPFAVALRYWLRLGFISFGGPAGQIAIMHRDLVEQRRWISEGRFLHALNYCMMLPGPEAQQLATYIGWLLHGVRGGIAAGVLFVLPSLVILILLSWAYLALGAAFSADILYGIRPAVVAIVLFAAWRIGSKTLRAPILWGISAAAFVAVFAWELPFPLIVLAAGLLGWALNRRLLAGHRQHAATRTTAGPALIDEHTPTPAHALHTRRRFLMVLASGLLLWGLGWLTTLWLLPEAGQDTAQRMATFFTQAALVTFGGAYAVMPYVFQNAVEAYAWLSPAQMMDGLALGESTPGPLIMVVAFIGFIAGWGEQLLGPQALLLAGVTGAVLATFFTFLPSFIFILAGGPLVERSRGLDRFHGPLTAITAAVVGAILYLAVFFAWHCFWPGGAAGGVDGVAVALALGALWALYRNWLGMVPLIAACALLGGAYRLLLLSV
jgi:chromate transporter